MRALYLVLLLLVQDPYIQKFSPPPEYKVWWQNMQECSGIRTLNMEEVSFVVVNDSVFMIRGTVHRIGAADIGNKTIYFSKGAERLQRVVSHEMLHMILALPGHPEVPFGYPCNV